MALRAGYGSKMKSVEGGEDVFSGRVWERLGCLGKVFVADHTCEDDEDGDGTCGHIRRCNKMDVRRNQRTSRANSLSS
jgi:hypothetical protein